MQEVPKESKRHVEAVLKALDILECFQRQPQLSLKKISEVTGLHKSRIMRLCGTLISRGYLLYEGETGQYKLGPKIISLSRSYEQSNDLLSLARPLMRNLAQETGESASLFIVDGLNRLCIAREEGTYSIRYNIIEGQRMPLYAGAGGKVLLAFAEKDLRKKVLKKGHLKKLTPHTINNPKQLLKELEIIREQGYAASFGERDAEVAALAAPIFNHEGKICASLSIAGPISRFSREHNVQHFKILLATAKRLSEMLGYADQKSKCFTK
ncbi:MAG: IclR family transcriptional regulator [Thermodesulfobacteriota bacterium]